MKKKILLLPLLSMALSLLTGCGSNKALLTYGTYINQNVNTLNEITNSELYEKAFNEEETFLLAVYQGDNSLYCNCWITYESVIANYVNNYHENVYVFNAHDQKEEIKDLNINVFEDDSVPYLYIFKGKKKLASFSYNNKLNKNIFSDESSKTMYNSVHKHIKAPVMYYVDDAYLDFNLNKANEAFVLYVRKSCGDCKYVLPNVIIPYINNHTIKKEIWVFDMQSYYDLSRSPIASEEEKAQYQNIKNKYKLSASASEKYGYLNGVVPTIQYYKSGELKSAAVYFNDVVSVNEEGEPYISDSFFRFERMNYLVYLVDFHNYCIFVDRNIKDEAGQTATGNYYWQQEKAAVYYTPLWNKFLDYYMA